VELRLWVRFNTRYVRIGLESVSKNRPMSISESLHLLTGPELMTAWMVDRPTRRHHRPTALLLDGWTDPAPSWPTISHWVLRVVNGSANRRPTFVNSVRQTYCYFLLVH